MANEMADRNDPDLKYLSVERSQFNDPATQAEWTQKRLVWVPHETQVTQGRVCLKPFCNPLTDALSCALEPPPQPKTPL